MRKIESKASPLGYPWEAKTAKRLSREASKKILQFCTRGTWGAKKTSSPDMYVFLLGVLLASCFEGYQSEKTSKNVSDWHLRKPNMRERKVW